MKAQQLAEKLLEHPDFNVELFDFTQQIHCRITGIADIGYSEKVINLNFEQL